MAVFLFNVLFTFAFFHVLGLGGFISNLTSR